MKIAVFGANGQVGSECCTTLLSKGHDVIELTRQQADFSNPTLVKTALLDCKPEFVVNACAYTAVDKAESEIDLADKVNHLSVAALADGCKELAIPLLHISTDYVFSGDGSVPYKEEDQTSPLGEYGRTKFLGEEAVRSKLPEHIILRTSWVFGLNGNNFVKTMLRLAAERDYLRVVDDQVGRPTYVGDIVNTISSLIDLYEPEGTLPWGTYHCSSEGVTSWFGFAQQIFEMAVERGVLQNSPTVEPIPTLEFPTPAPRPRYSVLSTEKLSKLLGAPMPHWLQGLTHFLNSTKEYKGK